MVWRRRKSVVDLRLQLWMAFELLAVVFGFCALLGSLLFVPPMSSLFGSEQEASAVFETLTSFILSRWPVVVGACVVLLAMGLLLSHRLAGPMYGLSKVLHDWRQGKRTSRVYFRKYDYLLPLLRPLNDYFDSQEQHHRTVSELAKQLKAQPDQASQIADKLASLQEPKP